MKIKLNAPTVYQCEGVRLVPGANEVDDSAAEKLLKNPLVQADIKAGRLEVVDAKAEAAAAAKAKADADAKAKADAEKPAQGGFQKGGNGN